MREIERKFLVKSEAYKEAADQRLKITQAYLNSDPERSVRVRVKEQHSFLTIKGKSGASGTSRFEWEREIPVEDARKLLEICEPGKIEKIRYEVSVGKHVFEVDEFAGENQGLIIAEIELESEDEEFERPAWLGEEVTGKAAYYNSQLSKRPFSSW